MGEPSVPKTVEKPRKPVIDRCRPIAQQCRELLLEEVGDKLMREIFNRSKEMKKQCVLLLHDLVHHGEVGISDIQSTLFISNWLILNNRLSRSENLVPV